jgi:DNA-binding beta-propeller fold protein YncE
MKATRRAAWILVALGLLAFASPAAADRVYFSTGGGIVYANLETGVAAKFEVTGASTIDAKAVAIDPAAGKIYWSAGSGGNSRIAFANLDGSGGQSLSTSGAPINYPSGIALDAAAGRVYWGNYQGPGGRLGYADTDGSGGGEISTTGVMAGNVTGIALDPAGSRLYWTNENNVPPSYAKLDNSGAASLNVTGAPIAARFLKGLAIDPNAVRIYWTSYKSSSPYEPLISSAALDESGGSNLSMPGAPGEFFDEGLAIDPTTRRVYFAESGLSGGIYYAALDGSGAHKFNLSGLPMTGARYPTLLKAPLGTEAPKLNAQIALRPRFLTCDEGTWAGNLPGSQLYRAPRTFTYQWLKDGQPVPGATKSNIGVEGAPGGDYACQVTATNAGGSTTQISRSQFVCCPVGPNATASRVALVRGGKAELKLTCPSGIEPCDGRLHLESKRPPRRKAGASVRPEKKPKFPNLPVVYGEHSFSIPGGATGVVKVKLSRRAKAQLAASKQHRLKAALAGTGVVDRTLLLKRAPKPKRRF